MNDESRVRRDILSANEQQSLVSPDSIEFAKLKRTFLSPTNDLEGQKKRVAAACKVLDRSSLSFSDKSRRARALMLDLGTGVHDREFIGLLSQLSEAIRSGIADALPVTEQMWLHKPIPPDKTASIQPRVAINVQPAKFTISQSLTSDISASTGVSLADETPYHHGNTISDITTVDPYTNNTTGTNIEPSSPDPSIHQIAERKDMPGSEGPVIILLSPNEQPANQKVLRYKGFVTFRISSHAALMEQLKALDICGFVIDGSFWESLRRADQEDKQRETLEAVASYSSLAYIVIDDTGFTQPDKIREWVQDKRLRELTLSDLRIVPGGRVSDTHDLPHFNESAEAIFPGNAPELEPADLTVSEHQSLMVALRGFYRTHFKASQTPLKSVSFQTLRVVPNKPKVLLVRFNNSFDPVVVKIGSSNMIADEFDRYTTYIAPYYFHYQQYIAIHSSNGILISRAVSSVENPTVPAQTFNDELQSLWNDEWWSPDDSQKERIASLLRATEHTCWLLKNLNSQPCNIQKHKSYAITVASEPKEPLNVSGVAWYIHDVNQTDIDLIINKAHTICKDYLNKAIVHGDLHLGNVIVRGHGDPWLIDFANSGPGHPCYDLVRLECALAFQHLRPLGTEDEWQSMQKAISVSHANFEILSAQLAHWFLCPSNKLLIQAMLHARDTAFEVLSKYGLGRSESQQQYMAIKFINACNCLWVPRFQVGLVRPTILALISELKKA